MQLEAAAQPNNCLFGCKVDRKPLLLNRREYRGLGPSTLTETPILCLHQPARRSLVISSSPNPIELPQRLRSAAGGP
jgi:hypothetical protein